MTSHQEIPFIENGMALTRNGYRQIVFTPDMVVRDVYTVRTRGSTEQHSSVQRAFEGDVLVRTEWHPFIIKISRLKNGRWVKYEDDTLWDSLPTVLQDFLSPVTRTSFSYLPEGYGWDGVNTESSLKKLSVVSNFLKGIQEYHLERIKTLAHYSSLMGMPTKWEKAFKGIKHFNHKREPELVDGLVLWFTDGRVEYWDVNFTDKFRFPVGVYRYAKIYTHCYKNSAGIYYGIKWDLFVI